MGPVMLDIQGLMPTGAEADLIRHPRVGGVILFTRNYNNPTQLQELTTALKQLKSDLIIAVDHEGGRVQRFRPGFSEIPPMRLLGDLYDQNAELAQQCAHALGFVLSWELVRHGVNLSFTPVLDLDYGTSEVIGNRAFHRDPKVVALLCEQLMAGLHQAGLPAVGKHFPGHGFVAADSHLDLPVDDRSLRELETDLLPYQHLIPLGLDAVMPAHVVYQNLDSFPAGFSSYWLKQILRQQLHFQGVIFSDDLSMEGAVASGPPVERARLALQAGCDMVLVCNNPAAAHEVVMGIDDAWREAESAARMKRMMGHVAPARDAGERLLANCFALLEESFPGWNNHRKA